MVRTENKGDNDRYKTVPLNRDDGHDDDGGRSFFFFCIHLRRPRRRLTVSRALKGAPETHTKQL